MPSAHNAYQTAEKMADVTEESKMAASMLKNYANEVKEKVVQTVRAPLLCSARPAQR